jgi:hypothetical protein
MADTDSTSSTGLLGDPSSGGGLMNFRDPAMLMHLGLGIMSAAKYGGNLGDGISGALTNYYNQRLAQQRVGMGSLELMRQRLLMGAAMNEFQGGAPQGAAPSRAPTPGAQPPVAPAGLLGPPQQAPQGPQSPQQDAPSWLTPPSQADIYSTPVSGISPGYLRGTAILSGRSPLPDLASLREQQLKLSQQQYAPVIARMDTMIKADKPTQYMQADPEFKAAWPVLAQHLGLDPQAGLNDANVRTAFSFARNNLASALSEATIAPPVQQQSLPGPYGSLYQREPVEGKLSQVTGPSYPSFSLEKGATMPGEGPSQSYVIPVQTGGYPGSGRGAAPRSTTVRAAATSGGAAATPAAPGSTLPSGAIATGIAPPSGDQAKAAALASDMRAGLSRLQQLESTGYVLSPKARAAIVNAATSEEGGLTNQLISQEALKHALSSNDQTYMAALMPVLQGAGHSMGGARLTTSQVRQLLESVAPVDTKNVEAMQQINQNRLAYYTGVLGEAGQAAYLPQYQKTLASDWRSLAAGQPLAFGAPASTAKPLAPGESRTLNGVTITRLKPPSAATQTNPRVGVINRGS